MQWFVSWERFTQTGRIDDYLVYHAQYSSEQGALSGKGIEFDANFNRGDSCSGQDGWR